MKVIKTLLLLAVVLSTTTASISAQKCCCTGKTHKQSMHHEDSRDIDKNYVISAACCCPNHGKCEIAPVAQMIISYSAIQFHTNRDFATSEYPTLKPFIYRDSIVHYSINNKFLLKSKEPPHYILHRSLLF